jgi:dynein heavy chain
VPGGGAKDPLDYWTAAKGKVLNGALLNKCKSFDKDHIKPEIIETLKVLIELPIFEDSVIEKASIAAWGLSKWVRAMV